MSEIDHRFVELPTFDKALVGKNVGNPVLINENEFVWIPNVNADIRGYHSHTSNNLVKQNQPKSLIKYNIHTKSWSKFIPYPSSNYRLCGPGVTFDSKNNKICAYDGDNMTFIDIKSHKFEIHKTNNDDQYSGLTFIDGKLHIIGDSNGPSHSIWNSEQNALQTVHKFENYIDFDIRRFSGAPLVNVVSRKILILFMSKLGRIFVYDYSKDETQRKWKDIKHILYKSTSYPQAYLTGDDKHVILVGGIASNNIYVLDIDDDDDDGYKLTLWKSDIKCFRRGIVRGVVVGMTNESLVIGWIRHLNLFYDGVETVPMDVLNMIIRFCRTELLHCLEIYGKMHCAISVADILQTRPKQYK